MSPAETCECTNPLVSVAMGAYNAAQYLPTALESLLEQSFINWECVVCDDGSSDDTLRILKHYAAVDARIHVIEHSTNKGLSASLNDAIEASKGSLIGRMDADDITSPDRLEREVALMTNLPEVAVCSTWAYLMTEAGQVWGEHRTVERPSVRDFLRGSPMIHAASMMRRSCLPSIRPYNEALRRTEDYDLWLRLARVGAEFANLPEYHYYIRLPQGKNPRSGLTARLEEIKVRALHLPHLAGPVRALPYILKPLFVWLTPDILYRWVKARYQQRADEE